MFRFASGATATLETVWSMPDKTPFDIDERMSIIGTEGIIDLRADTEPFAQHLAGSPFRPRAEMKGWVPVSSAGLGQPEPLTDLRQRVGGHQGPVRDLIAAIGENRAPLCSDRDGRDVVEMTLGILESHRREGVRVGFPLADRTNPLTKL
jgi:predicted dehydrogenase